MCPPHTHQEPLTIRPNLYDDLLGESQLLTYIHIAERTSVRLGGMFAAGDIKSVAS